MRLISWLLAQRRVVAFSFCVYERWQGGLESREVGHLFCRILGGSEDIDMNDNVPVGDRDRDRSS